MRYLLSIFNFETLKARPGLLVLQPVLLGTVLLLAAGETGLRLLIPPSHIPTGSWKNVELRDQVRQLETMNKVDLMFTGSSIAAVNLPPAPFDIELARHGVQLDSFNAGIRGCNYLCIRVGFTKLFLSGNKPNYVVLVVGLGDVNEANTFVINRSQQFLKSFAIKDYEAALIDGLSYSWLFGFRNEIREYLKTGKWIYEESKIGRQGHIQMGDKKNKRYKVNFLIQPDGPIATALFDLVKDLLAQGVKVIILPGLMDSETRSLVDVQAQENYELILENLGQLDNVKVLDVEHIIPADKEFIDRVHLNSAGSAAYSEAVARHLLEKGFPW